MKKRSLVLALAALIVFGSGRVSPALADAAPPVEPPGSSISSGSSSTHVQMLSERVDITIGSYQGPIHPQDEVGAHVDAYFYMVNRGTQDETMDVWFPLQGVTDDNEYYGSELENFRVWVDGKPNDAQRVEEHGINRVIPWATWSTTFPVGETVMLHVAYEQQSYIDSYGYILETGAGWYGPIGAGTILVHYPFEVNSLNTSANVPPGIHYTASGTDMIWSFTNLEPTHPSNIQFWAIPPGKWGDILAAQQRASQEPGSLDMQLKLARALQEPLWYDHELVPTFDSRTLVDLACAAYEKALQIDPGNADIFFEYLSFLGGIGYSFDLPDPRVQPVLVRALAVAPDNPKFLAIQNDLKARYAQATQNAIEALTPSATNPPPSATPAATNTPLPTATDTPTSTPSPTLTPTPMVTYVGPATSSPEDRVRPQGALEDVTPVLLSLVIAGFIGWVWLRRRKREPGGSDQRNNTGS